MAGGVPIQQTGGMISPQPMGSSAPMPPPPADEAQNTSGILSLLARTLQLGKPWQNPYADPAATIVDQAISQPPQTDDGQRQRGMPQVYPKGFQQSMGGGLGPAPSAAPRPAPVPQAAPQAPAPAEPAAEPPPGPGVPPPSVPEDGSDNVAMGTGPGRALAHDQAAGIAGGAVSLGHQVANDPSITGQIIQDLRTKGYGDDDQSKWLALAQAGFATAASRSPFALQALGEGASAGLQGYQNSRAQRAQQLYTAAELSDRQQQLQQSGQYQTASLAQDDKKLAQADKEFQANLAIAQKKLPGDLALQQAQAQYYADHGTYYQGRANTPGSYLGQAYQNVYQADLAAGKSPADATTHAMQVVKGTLTQRDRLINQYLGVFKTGLGPVNTPTPEALAEAGAWADDQLASGAGGAGTPTPAPAAAAAPGPSDAAYLKANPAQAANFDARFGTKTDPNPSKKILGQ